MATIQPRSQARAWERGWLQSSLSCFPGTVLVRVIHVTEPEKLF
jgi:hypothetical protein